MTISGHTRVVGVIGDPIAHTRSPAMHNAAFEALGLDWLYVAFHVQPHDVEPALRGFRAAGMRGFNATIPHKQALATLIPDLTAEASFIGAVNTVVFGENDSVIGENTDASGFVAALDEAGIPRPTGKRAVVLGAGGAARAVVVALANVGVSEIVIVNRTVHRAEQLAKDVAARLPVRARAIQLANDALAAELDDAALLVNATAAGMEGQEPLPIDAAVISPNVAVYDIIYTPRETPLLKAAASRGCATLNGIGMLVHQGAEAFELWTGVSAPIDVMRRALIASL